MSHEDLLKALTFVINGTHTHCTDAKIYHVPNRNILQVSTTLESIQEQWDNPLVESYNQQQIFLWVINHLNLPSVQGHGYTEREIREAVERRILENSRYSEIIEIFGVPKSTICLSLNVIFPPLKYSSLKHLWGLVRFGKTTKKIVR